MRQRIMGVDPSTKMGLVLLEQKGNIIQTLEAEEYSSKHKGMERLSDIGQKIDDCLTDWKPKAVYIEGYSFMSKHQIVTMAEVGTVIRYFLWQRSFGYREVPPPTLKKFVTGKGNTKKDVMLLQVYKNWGFTTHNDNIADAYSLAMYGIMQGQGLVREDNTWKKMDSAHLTYTQLEL